MDIIRKLQKMLSTDSWTNRNDNQIKQYDILLTLNNYIKIGGKPKRGMKLFTNPDPDGVNYLIRNNYISEHSRFYTLVEIVEDGVKVEETDALLGTSWLFLTVPSERIKFT